MQRQNEAGNFTEKQEAVMERKLAIETCTDSNTQQLHLYAISLKTAKFATFFCNLTSRSLFCTMRISIQMTEEDF